MVVRRGGVIYTTARVSKWALSQPTPSTLMQKVKNPVPSGRPTRLPKSSASMCGLFMCIFGKKAKKAKRREKHEQTVAPPAPQEKPTSHVLVLIMLECDGKAFNNFIAQLPKEGASYNQRYEQPGLDLRGFKTALEVQYARDLRKSQVGKDAGVLGVAYFGGVLLNPPPFELPSGLRPRRQTRSGRNVGLSDLWHLEAVDASPSHSAGRGVNMYVMDSGINENHAVSFRSEI